jgi:hypothetical protein
LKGSLNVGLSSLLRRRPVRRDHVCGNALVVVGGAALMTFAAALGTWRVDPLAALKME